jgi:hypothetical protein
MTVNIGGLYLVFRFQQHIVRKETKLKIKLGVPKEELFFIRIDQSNLHLVEWIHKKEFRFKGVMYDVIRKKILDDHSIEYCCINDKQETKLFAHLDEEVNRNLAQRQHSSIPGKQLIKLLSFSFLLPITADPLKRSALLFKFKPIQFDLNFRPKEIITPPPQFV